MDYKNLQIELTNACNLSCVECPHVNMERPIRNMSEAVFTKILQEFIANKPVNAVVLHKDGEPLLNNRLTSYIDRISAVNPKCTLDIYTNGLLLTENFLNHLASKPNKSRVLISFHFWESNGQRNDYQPLTEMLLKVLQKPMPKIEFVMASHVTKLASLPELEEWQRFWKNAKLANPITGVHVNHSISTWAGKVPDGNTRNTVCSYGNAEYLFIGNTGNILPCCADLEEEIILGNVLMDNIPEVMQKRMDFYKEMQAQVYNYPLCRRCVGKE